MGLIPKILAARIILTGLCLSTPFAAYADTTYALSCPESVIKGSIPYSIIGTYRSIFKECSGKVVYDSLHAQVKSVEISVMAASIESSCKWCDRNVRSKQIFDVTNFPVITFKSGNFENRRDGSWVFGMFSLHGVTKILRSRFEFKEQKDNTLFLKGGWELKRKDFNIIWNKWFDYGGWLVGDYIMIDWKGKAHKI